MIAQNPITGAPINIIRSEASIWRNKKTLLWLRDQATSVPWDRFDTVTVGFEDTQKWLDAKKRVDFVILPDVDEEIQAWFLGADKKAHRMIFVTRTLVTEIGESKFRSLGLTNVVCLEELHLMYPFLGHEWTKASEDAVLITGALLRYSVLSGVSN